MSKICNIHKVIYRNSCLIKHIGKIMNEFNHKQVKLCFWLDDNDNFRELRFAEQYVIATVLTLKMDYLT